MTFWVITVVLGFGGCRMLWHFVGVVMLDLKRLGYLDKAYSNPEHRGQYALYQSLARPTKWDCLAWATERELKRELRRRRIRQRLFWVAFRIARRSCDTALAVIDKLGGGR